MRPFLLAASIALALSLPAGADHCETWSTSEPEITQRPYYVDWYCGIDWCFLVEVYEESNGIEGLQRQDDWADDTCHGSIQPDTHLY